MKNGADFTGAIMTDINLANADFNRAKLPG
jgi:uncharacterized protein YjbI with pentapeptide repeats